MIGVVEALLNQPAQKSVCLGSWRASCHGAINVIEDIVDSKVNADGSGFIVGNRAAEAFFQHNSLPSWHPELGVLTQTFSIAGPQDVTTGGLKYSQ